MQYSEVPKKKVLKMPVYESVKKCLKCNSKNIFPGMNMPGSYLTCGDCKKMYVPKIIGCRNSEI